MCIRDRDASALCPIAKEAALTMLDILSQTPPFSYMNISKHRERIEKVFTAVSYTHLTLRILCLSSAVSGFWMLIAFLLSKTIHKFLTPFALLSILCYSIGFIPVSYTHLDVYKRQAQTALKKLYSNFKT